MCVLRENENFILTLVFDRIYSSVYLSTYFPIYDPSIHFLYYDDDISSIELIGIE